VMVVATVSARARRDIFIWVFGLREITSSLPG
jgi:hypothetical protein